MENLRRKIKLFWLDHSGPIKLYTIIILGVICAVQFLNNVAIDYNDYMGIEKDTNTKEVQKIEDKEENTKNINLIKKFTNYCLEGKIENAYSLLSKDCKDIKYPTIEEFKNNYYNLIFNKKLNIEVESDKEKNLYKVIFYEDILESGKIENRENITQFYKIKEENETKKIFINI